LFGGLETRPYPSQSALDQPPVFQRSPSVGRMLGGPQYPGGTNLPHSSLPGSAAIPAYHQPAAAFTNQHHQLHAQPRPYFDNFGSLILPVFCVALVSYLLRIKC